MIGVQRSQALTKYLRDYAILFSIAGAVVLLDQITKQIVRTNLPLGQVFHPELWLSRYVRIVHWYNTGATGGLLQGMNALFSVIAFIAAGVILYYFPRVPRTERLLRLALGLFLGGALGNLIDRLLLGYVTDFISVGNFALNIADASIALGAVSLSITPLRREQRQMQLAGSAAQAQEKHPEGPGTASSPPQEGSQGE